MGRNRISEAHKKHSKETTSSLTVNMLNRNLVVQFKTLCVEREMKIHDVVEALLKYAVNNPDVVVVLNHNIKVEAAKKVAVLL